MNVPVASSPDEGEVGDRGVAVVDVDVGRCTRNTGAGGERLQIPPAAPSAAVMLTTTPVAPAGIPALPTAVITVLDPVPTGPLAAPRPTTGVDDSCRSHRDEL